VAGENELHQHMLSAPLSDPTALRPHGFAAIGCVCELEAFDFEPRAWLEHVLKQPDAPDLDGYLAAHMSADLISRDHRRRDTPARRRSQATNCAIAPDWMSATVVAMSASR
jgi:hypothetical protein